MPRRAAMAGHARGGRGAAGTNGDVDLDDLRAKVAEHAEHLAALMITYPSTHGVFEETSRDICAARARRRRPGLRGRRQHQRAGGPGAAGQLRRRRLPPEPAQDVLHSARRRRARGRAGRGARRTWRRSCRATRCAAGAAARASAGVARRPTDRPAILPISWAYIRDDGWRGSDAGDRRWRSSTANYIAARLDEHYPVLYTGENGMVAHECILDLRPITKATGVTVDDVAKRLMDYGFHAPTMSFPVAGTLMVEPTESESTGRARPLLRGDDRDPRRDRPGGDRAVARDDNPLRNAPHTAECLLVEGLESSVPAGTGRLPAGEGFRHKFWPPVAASTAPTATATWSCACPPVEAFAHT